MVRWLALVIVGVAACQPRPDDPLATLALGLTAPLTVRAGTEAQFRLTLTNTSERTVSLLVAASGGYAFDIIVRGRGGVLIWRRLAAAHQDVARGYDLAPDEQLVLEASWGLRDSNGHPIPPGEYTVEGLLVGPDARSATASMMPVMRVVP
jgi:hypothetical protein